MIPNNWGQHPSPPENPPAILQADSQAPSQGFISSSSDLKASSAFDPQSGNDQLGTASKMLEIEKRKGNSPRSPAPSDPSSLIEQLSHGSPDRSSAGISAEMSDFGGDKNQVQVQENDFLSEEIAGLEVRNDLFPPVSEANQENELSKLVAQMQKVNWNPAETTANSTRSNCQIYLTFPAHSTFTEDDVKAYFSKWGTVEDVRIPLKEKRNFGFVTFTSPVPVKAILSCEVEHKVKDIVVLVKPYCEKGKPTKPRNAPRGNNKGNRANPEATVSRNQRVATQFPTRDDILEVAGRYSAMPLQYGGLYRPDSQTSLLLLQQQQLQQAQKQILQYKQQERILQQQVKDLQLQVRALQQQQKTYWKDTPQMNPNIPGFGPISAQFGNALSFERRLEHAHSIDSTFGKILPDKDHFQTPPDPHPMARTLSGGSSFLKDQNFSLSPVEPIPSENQGRQSGHSEVRLEDSGKIDEHFSFSKTTTDSSLFMPLDNTYGWPNVEYVPQPQGPFLPSGSHSGHPQTFFQGGTLGPSSNSCQSCFEMTLDLVVLDCQHTFCVSCFSKELSKASSICTVCHSPVSVSATKTDNPWRSQTGILPPYTGPSGGGMQGGWQG